jgi:DNA invertase Pin-like site-specific DNA recombinase
MMQKRCPLFGFATCALATQHASGKNTTRPELEACLKSLREDDTLVIWRLDRLGRSLGDLIELTNELQSRRIDLESLTEKLDTGSPTGRRFPTSEWIHVRLALVEALDGFNDLLPG